MIVYDGILSKLKEAGYSAYRLRKEKLIPESTIQRIRRNEPINTETLDVICELTGLQPGDLLRHKKNREAD